MDILQDVDCLSFTFFNSKDVVRHSLVQKVVQAYDKFECKQEKKDA